MRSQQKRTVKGDRRRLASVDGGEMLAVVVAGSCDGGLRSCGRSGKMDEGSMASETGGDGLQRSTAAWLFVDVGAREA